MLPASEVKRSNGQFRFGVMKAFHHDRSTVSINILWMGTVTNFGVLRHKTECSKALCPDLTENVWYPSTQFGDFIRTNLNEYCWSKWTFSPWCSNRSLNCLMTEFRSVDKLDVVRLPRGGVQKTKNFATFRPEADSWGHSGRYSWKLQWVNQAKFDFWYVWLHKNSCFFQYWTNSQN